MYDSNEVLDDLIEIATPSRIDMPVRKRAKRIDEYDDKMSLRGYKAGTGRNFRGGEQAGMPVKVTNGRLEADRIREGMKMIHASEGDE